MYTICGILTCLITNKANEFLLSKYKSNRKVGRMLIGLVVMIFSFVAGLRDFSIGTDIGYYMLSVFNSALRNSFHTFWNINSSTIEPLYLLLTYFSTMISDNPHLLMGIISFIISTLVLLRLADYKEYRKMWLGIFVFNFVFFPISLNLMRQSIAMSILFYSTRYIFTEHLHIRKFVLGTLLSMGFHLTGVIGFFLLVLVFYYRKVFDEEKNISKEMTIKSFVLIGVLIIGVFLFDKVIALIVPISSFTSKYSVYYTSIQGGIDLNPLLVRLPFIIIIFCNRKDFYKNKSENYILFLLLLTDGLASLLRSYSTTLYRLSIYFAYFKMLALPNFTVSYKGKKRISAIMIICVLIYLIWIYQIIIQGNEQVYPYVLNGSF